MSLKSGYAGPIDDSYWAASAKLIIGMYPFRGAEDRATERQRIRALLDAGVRTVIDFRTPAEPPSVRSLLRKLGDDDVAWLGIPIQDGEAPNRAELITILDAIDSAIARGRVVYAHCMGGRGRAGTVAACWWIRHGVFDSEGALEALMERRLGQPHGEHPSPETAPQLRLVRAWQAGD